MVIAFILLTASWLHNVCAQSEPLAEDPLTYSSGDLKGQNGGSGWKEGWESLEGIFSAIGEGVKVDRDQLAAKDDKSANATRRFALPTPDVNRIYFSVEIQTSDMKGQYFAALVLHQKDLQGAVGVGIMNGKASGWGGTLEATAGLFETIAPWGTYLLVGRVDFENDSTSSLTVWVNPEDESSQSSTRTFDTIGLERLPFVLAELFVANLEGAGDVTFRHLIVSTEWPVPPAK